MWLLLKADYITYRGIITGMIMSCDDLVKIFKKINPLIVTEALNRSEVRILDIESDRKALKLQVTDYIKWVAGFCLLVLSITPTLHKANHDVLLVGCVITSLLLAIVIIIAFDVFSLESYPRAGTEPKFWAHSDILTGGEHTLSFMKARILIEHYCKSIPEGEKSYKAMCNKFDLSQNCLKFAPVILIFAAILQILCPCIISLSN